MKRIICLLVTFVLLVSLFAVPSFAENNSNATLAKSVLSRQVVFDDLLKFTEAVNTNEPDKILNALFEAAPNFIAEIKKALDEDFDSLSSSSLSELTTPPNTPERNVYAAKYMMNSQVLLDDFCKLTDVIKEGDAGKIFMLFLEIYPDFTAECKKGFTEYDNPIIDASLIQGAVINFDNSDFVWIIMAALIGIAIGAGVTLIIIKKKNKSA
ncbi:MAG: hypothetical protein KBS52_03085 [Clostridiales bacterium]|nr:hypothetical protein [Candidatus Equinaster intestinalis]